MVRFFNALGAPLLSFIQYLGELVLLAADTFRSIFTHKLRWKLFLNQVVEVGLLSQLVVIITGGFTGAVFSAQTFFQFNKLGMGSAVGAVVSVALCRELAPVLTSLMVGGRVGAGMTAEIGTMKVTEQIDALRALATSPVRKLVVPKVLATTLMFPVLTIVSNAVGIFGGLVIAVANLHITGNFYMRSVIDTVKYNDLASGIGKTVFFGFAVGLIACFNGLRTSGGADGVGRSTTQTVVMAAITVLILDFFLTKLFLLAF